MKACYIQKMWSCGKTCGVDFLPADDHILTTLFNAFIIHGYFTWSAIVPIIKNITGDLSNINKHRPIALVIAICKIFEHYQFIELNEPLDPGYNQFGFKKQHSTDMCIFAGKTVI